jgi:hypothetical protein
MYAVLLSLGPLAACATDPVGANDPRPEVLSVSPSNGETGVSTAGPVVVTFSHPMMAGMEMNVVLHEASVTGPSVVGTATWSTDRKILFFVPTTALKSATTYVLHIAPTLRAANGQVLDHGSCASLGGRSVTSGMMGGGMPAGGMMGGGWQMAEGFYGVIFSFTTA